MFMGGNGQIRNSKKKSEKGNPVLLGIMIKKKIKFVAEPPPIYSKWALGR